MLILCSTIFCSTYLPLKEVFYYWVIIEKACTFISDFINSWIESIYYNVSQIFFFQTKTRPRIRRGQFLEKRPTTTAAAKAATEWTTACQKVGRNRQIALLDSVFFSFKLVKGLLFPCITSTGFCDHIEIIKVPANFYSF